MRTQEGKFNLRKEEFSSYEETYIGERTYLFFGTSVVYLADVRHSIRMAVRS